MNYLNEREFQEYQEKLAIIAKHLKTARAHLIDESTHQKILNNPTYALRMNRIAIEIDAIIIANNLKEL
jgi:hypothetical protein